MYKDYKLKVERILPDNNETINQIRRLGFIPGVLYGKDITATRIKMDGKSLQEVLARDGSNAIFEVILEGKARPVIVKEVQREPVTNRILHIDLHNINKEERIKTTLPINVTGNNNVIRRGGILQHQLKELEIVGLSSHIPPYIKVDVSKLSPGQSLRVQDVY
jgi:large subunit ribosomal protein L25